jgi:hypothetical protein
MMVGEVGTGLLVDIAEFLDDIAEDMEAVARVVENGQVTEPRAEMTD